MRRAVALFATVVGAFTARAQGTLPQSRLAMRDSSGDAKVFWRSDAAPSRWDTAPIATSVQWRRISVGVEAAELALEGTGEAWRTRVVLVRLDPTRLTLSLDTAFAANGDASWNVKRAPASAVFAANAGQFRSSMPWGRVILNGRQFLPPERGPLAVTFVVDSSGAAHWLHDGEALPSATKWTFQSYPEILRDRHVPIALRVPDSSLDVAHRDARLALGRLENGGLLFALTRFDGLGGVLKSVPFGLTVPEMSALMGALGARDAVLLDGGISAQLIAGSGTNRVTFSAWRNVPLGLVAHVRADR
jgi:hypothetical protein